MLLFVDASRGASYDLRCCFIGDDGCDNEVLIPLEMLAPDRLPDEVYEKTIVVNLGRLCRAAHLPAPVPLTVARAGDTE